MNNILAKSNGVSLLDHSHAVEIVSEVMAKSIFNDDFNYDLDKDHLKVIKLSALLHDIGKCVKQYQDFYNNTKSIFSLTHNEIGWAVLNCIGENKNVLNTIYWHHAKPFFGNKSNDDLQTILRKISDDDFDIICDFYTYITNKNLNKIKVRKNFEDLKKRANKTPDYYNKSILDNSEFLSYRNIIISADRLVSSLSNNELELVLKRDYKFIESLINEEKALLKYVIPEKYDNLRFKKQEEIVSDINKNTCILKAPAGFGKTMLGLLWSLKSNKKLLWICPRNIIVTSVYDSINDELKALGLEKKLSVELFLTGERKKCTDDTIKDYCSDIVITNIDNYLNVVTESKYSDKGYTILNRDVVFDEFHEFIDVAALFSCFITLMYIRNNYTTSKTLLLSATPSLIQQNWDTDCNKTLILPSNNKHYNPAHFEYYNTNLFYDDNNIKSKLDSVTITNSIKNSQLLKKEHDFDLLLHSKFTEEDKECNINTLRYLYGKSNRHTTNKSSVISAPIIQASMDVSFKNLTEYVMSPENTLQRIGRCNRWGDYTDSTLNFILNCENKSENAAIRNFYNVELNKLWIDFLQNRIKSKMNLSDLYDIYNDFNNINSNKIKEYITEILDKSLKNLIKIIPQKNIITDTKSKNISNKDNLRTNGYNCYVTCKIDGTDDFIEPYIETILFDKPTFFDEDKNTPVNISKTIKLLVNKKLFNFTKRHINLTPEQLYKLSYNIDTPYIALNKKYSKLYGVADLDIFEN